MVSEPEASSKARLFIVGMAPFSWQALRWVWGGDYHQPGGGTP